MKFNTKAIHGGQKRDPSTGAVMPPIYQTSTFAQETPGAIRFSDYSRAGNPTRSAYEACLAELENGQHCISFASGMSAIDAVLHSLQSGDHVLLCDDVYGGTFRLCDKIMKRFGLEFSFVDMQDLAQVEAAIQDRTRLVWMESPTNPTLKIFDIARIAEIAHKNNALMAVDNTFMSPYFQKPLDLGADIVMHSVTKYLNGHSDVIGGALVVRDSALEESLRFLQLSIGAVPAPMDCFLALRGMKTLPIRMERHQENALKIAQFLEEHPKVDRVLYPGLDSHPQHELAKKQCSGFSGMLTFYIQGGLTEARSFLEKVQIFTLAESLGGVESLIEHPAIMTHASVPPEQRAKLGITDQLIRISVGIEDLDDLRADLQQALG